RVTGQSTPATARDDRGDLGWVAAVFLLAVAARLFYLGRLETPAFDPWRHLALVRNIRDGAGFTLFDGQPYLWYGPAWYYLLAALPRWFRFEWFTALLSAACAPLTYLWLRRTAGRRGGVVAPFVASLMMALSGPVVAYTCHYGPEAPALLSTLTGLVLCSLAPARGWAWSLAGGLAYGLALTLRLNFIVSGPLFLPWMTKRRRDAGLIVLGAAIPLAANWWRNHAILERYAWVFTWDGLATRTADFDFVSTLVIQRHPAVGEALRRLHLQIVPHPEWLFDGDGVAWGPLVFLVAGLAGALAARSGFLLLSALGGFAYFALFDGSMSANFFRIHLPIFPALFAGLALASVGRTARRRAVALALVGFALLGGSVLFEPPGMIGLPAVTPPAGLLSRSSYAVNSGFFQPEAIAWAHPELDLIGLPLEPDDLDDLLADFPDHRAILWHETGAVQPELRARLESDGRFESLGRARNDDGFLYEVFGVAGSAAP
ncbi:MAG TPA: hypothetical protein VD788_15080, partial [Candidatus Polarisedimenticolaceae bacterium]|nr:hypothetical protein [Candidatus Polarisedimenticolaceae bacterium]